VIATLTVNRQPPSTAGGLWDIVKANFTAAQLQASLIDFLDRDVANCMDLLDADVIWNPS